MKRQFAPGQTRRTHTKTRNGCIVCKRRKVKCTEERPSCMACFQRNTPCSYADQISSRNSPVSSLVTGLRPLRMTASEPVSTRRILPLPSTPDSPSDLNLTDLRLQHHFLTTCYPHLPAGNESIWTTDIPIIASQRPYLMHALLGLAATHLHLLSQHTSSIDDSTSSPMLANSAAKAIHHRTHALAGLHGALQAPVSTPSDSSTGSISGNGDPPDAAGWSKHHVDAMLACTYALTFQATYMADGLEEFVTMVRGCALITSQISEMGYQSSFDLSPEAHVDVLDEHWDTKAMPRSINNRWIMEGLRALGDVRSWVPRQKHFWVIDDTSVEWRFFKAVEDALAACGRGLKEGYVAFCRAYSVWYDCDGKDFERLVDRRNQVCRVLMAYFTAMELLLAPVFGARYESEKRRRHVDGLRILCVREWLGRIREELEADARAMVSWPMKVGELVGERARAWVTEGGSLEEFLLCEVWQGDNGARSMGGSIGEHHSIGRDSDGAMGVVYPTPEELR